MKYFALGFMVLFLFPAFSGERQLKYNNNTVVCVDDPNIGELNFFTWSAKEILDFLARDEFLKEKEWKAIEMNPQLALYIKKAADLGLEISESLCPFDENNTYSNGVYGSDDEVDAIRHFTMSAYLSFKVGKEKARKFMSAHENSEYENSNMMDYYNNELGFNFGEAIMRKFQTQKIRPTTELFIESIKQEVKLRHQLERGHRLDFMVLVSGPSVCAQRKYPNF